MPRQLSLPWDRDGALLSGVEFDFYAGGSPQVWQGLASSLGLGGRKSNTVDRFTFTFELLGPADGGRRDVVFIEFHATGSRERAKGNIVHWHVRRRRLVSGTPPPEVEALSERLGGLSTGLGTLCAKWPDGVSRSIHVDYDLSYFIDGTRWTPRGSLPKANTSNVGGDRHHFEPTLVSWAVSPPLGTISNITVGDISSRDDASVLAVTARGTWDTELHEAVLDRLDREVWSGVETFLKKRPHSRASAR